jgi:hypothetical protein
VSEYTDGKSLKQLKDDLVGVAQVGSPVYKRIEAEIMDRIARRQARWTAFSVVVAVVSLVVALVR